MTPLLLLPGMMCDARLFQPQIAALSGRHILITAPIGGADTMTALARTVLNAAPPRFAVAGLSMGGILAMEIIRQAPDRVAAVALMDTNPLAEKPDIQARRGPQIEAVQSGHLAEVMRDEMKPNYLTEGPDRAAILDLCMAMALDLGPEVFVNQSRALRDRPDQCETLRSFDGPALVLCGRDDALCPVSRHELMHDLLPNSTLKIIDGAGHLPTLEQPTKTTAALARWLEAI
ncbi:alpha/beta fold hydrolase [Phaeobacter italicus]|uniref:alpha/beta fold hydrolase n=1 Tax=Phaeobacter italicus TaxID=481446 RepID=UPI000186F9B6|nr:alpha/beta fold hydrolase [Phaeobacter italicus]EEB71411.1 alpha/beta hydrolase [Ruegeria sp. R11]CRL13117.1 AB hydrolase superfamily protein YdjP [Phaeobacter italicus]SFH33820.1 Pimeloyl-ACP methyl ester carboxylesterase [Phaeobacter italicus]